MVRNLFAFGLSLSVFAACNYADKTPQQGMPTLDVQVFAVARQDVPLYTEFVGQTFGQSDVEITSRVEGWVTSMNYKEGGEVKQGQVLYTIDPLPYQNKLDQSKGGLAEALRYPSFNLMAALGVYSQDLSSIFTNNALANVLNASVTGPVFQFGRNKRRVDIERQRSGQLKWQYEQVVLTALKDVQDGLVGIDTYRKERENLEKFVQTSRKTYQLSLARYDAGYSSYLELLDAERMLFDAENRACVVRREQLVALVHLYRALGGGWDPANIF